MVILMLSSTKFAQKKIEKQVNVKTTPAKMNPIIYLLGGIVPTIGQKEYDFGGLAPTNLEKYEALNGTTFELLNIQFGPKWQTEINPNTLGFAKWKENNK